MFVFPVNIYSLNPQFHVFVPQLQNVVFGKLFKMISTKREDKIRKEKKKKCKLLVKCTI